MIILNENDFDKVRIGLEGRVKILPTFVLSVLNEYIFGTVYADSSTPKTILIGTESGVFFVIGNEDNHHFNDCLFDLYSQRKKKNLRFTLFSSNENWNYIIKNRFKNNVRQMCRYSFNYESKKQLADKVFGQGVFHKEN